ncbi:MAG: ankyrin repeat domain-containing protein [Alphaproteobacteria bacterium]
MPKTIISNYNNGKNSLFSAINIYSLSDINWLIKKGVNINHKDFNANNILHYAIKEKKDLVLIKLLVESGVFINAININGFTPLDIAMNQQSDNDIVKYLRSKDAKTFDEILKPGFYIKKKDILKKDNIIHSSISSKKLYLSKSFKNYSKNISYDDDKENVDPNNISGSNFLNDFESRLQFMIFLQQEKNFDLETIELIQEVFEKINAEYNNDCKKFLISVDLSSFNNPQINLLDIVLKELLNTKGKAFEIFSQENKTVLRISADSFKNLLVNLNQKDVQMNSL